MTPFQALYGRAPPTLVRYTGGRTAVGSVEMQLADRDEQLKHLRCNLERAQERMKRYADQRRVEREFQVGELA